MFNSSLTMSDSANQYGFTTCTRTYLTVDDTTNCTDDTHMSKNRDWAATAYLSRSIYGKNSDLTVNEDSLYTTGGNDYVTNVAQSTTGNITGVYDMSGGSYERVAAVNSLTAYPSKVGYLTSKITTKYVDNFGFVSADSFYPTSFGHALYETSSNAYRYGNTSEILSLTKAAWNSSDSRFLYSLYSIQTRGGYWSLPSDAGIFNFYYSSGAVSSGSSWRISLVTD